MVAKLFTTSLDPQMYNGGWEEAGCHPHKFFFNFDKTIDCKELKRSVAVRLPLAEILMCQLCL